MTEKRSYTEILAVLETHIHHISNHLQNIDIHLERLNTTVASNKERGLQNTNNIRWICRIGTFILGGGGATTGITKLLGLW